MHFSTQQAVLLALLVVLGLPTRTAHAESVTPQAHDPPALPTEPSTNTSRHTIGWIVAGAGSVALLGSGYMFLLQDRKLDRMRAGQGAEVVEEVRGYRTASTVLFATGVAGLAVGLPLALIGDDDTRVVVSLERVVVSGTF